MIDIKKEFIIKARAVHGDKYNYSKIEYKNNKTKVEIICPIHGSFWTAPSNILNNHGCPKCGIDKIKNKLTLSTEEFIRRVRSVHGDKYDYSMVEYVDNLTKINIICPIHGEFSHTPKAHINGIGCGKCASDKMRMTKEEFIFKANKIHKNKYDYSKVKYVNYEIKVEITCPVHGLFWQTPHHHIRGQGCLRCGLINNSIAQRQTLKEFISKAKKVHGNKYNYSKVKYENNKTKVKIICPRHGEFEQSPNAHLRYGCRKCANNKTVERQLLNIEEFIKRAKKVHGDKYDYSGSEYIKSNVDIKITCPKHGEFYQYPANHWVGHGCQACANIFTKPCMDISNILKDSGISHRCNDRIQLYPLEIDIWVPDKSLGIEYHGLYYHSYDRKETTKEKNSHALKADLATHKSINLIQIFEDEWIEKEDLVKSMIRSRLGMNQRVMARNCLIKEIFNNEYKQFCEENHIQGYKAASIKYGLYNRDELINIMSFNHKKDYYEIERLCSKQGITVVGGASKLFKQFTKKHNPDKVISYCDRRYGTGNVYKKMGMKFLKITPPNYFYIKYGSKKRENRIKFQKHKLKNKLETFNPNLTEAENMFNNKYRRIWDAGHYKFEWSVLT